MEGRLAALTTGDGLLLPLPLAGLGERALALAIDGFVLAMVTSPFLFAQSLTDPWIPLALAAFIVRHAYFAGMGAVWHGATPGKRMLGLHVVALGGGPLTSRRLLVRSVVRDLELGLPLLAVSGVWVDGGVALWGVLAAWCCLFAVLPLAIPHRRRLADLLAGTTVARRQQAVAAPLPVVDPRYVGAAPIAPETTVVLDRPKMEVLARLLREVDPTTEAGQTVRLRVAQELAHQLGRSADQAAADPDGFLQGVYAELAAYHDREQRMGRTLRTS